MQYQEDYEAIQLGSVSLARVQARYTRAQGQVPPACRFCGEPADAYPLRDRDTCPPDHCPTCWHRWGRAIGFPRELTHPQEHTRP